MVGAIPVTDELLLVKQERACKESAFESKRMGRGEVEWLEFGSPANTKVWHDSSTGSDLTLCQLCLGAWKVLKEIPV